MASEDILSGIAAGADYLASALLNKEKLRLEERLMKQRMDLQAQYEDARLKRQEAREAKKVAKESIVQDANGNFVKRQVNAYGDVLKEVPASQYEIDTINNEKRQQQLTLDSLEAQAATNKFKAANLEADRAAALEDRALERRRMEAQIEASRANASADYARARSYDTKAAGLDAAAASDMGTATNELIKDYENLWKGYTEGASPSLTTQEVYDVARSSIKAAGKYNRNVGSTFQNALREYVKNKAASTTAKGFSLDNGN